MPARGARGKGSRPSWMGGPLGIAAAAVLWATDALVRVPSLGQLDSVWIVALEHVFAVLVMAVGLGSFALVQWVRRRALREPFVPGRAREWAALIFLGTGASALATVLFTESFRALNPTVTILLQKLQPLVAVGLSAWFLGERPQRAFYPWAAVALVTGIGLSVPELTGPGPIEVRLAGVGEALGAAFLWAAATVVGKAVVMRLSPWATTFWRFTFGGLGLGLVLTLRGGLDFGPVGAVLAQPAPLAGLLYMALGPGFVAMFLYYRGLHGTPAHHATWIELVFPVMAAILNWIILGAALTPFQLVAGGLLLLAIVQITQTGAKRH